MKKSFIRGKADYAWLGWVIYSLCPSQYFFDSLCPS